MSLDAYGHYRYKKDLKKSVGKQLRFVETPLHGPEYPEGGTGRVNMVGPWARSKRDWYATVTLKNHVIVKVE